MEDRGFCIASENVHHSEFGDEIVVINTLAGCYYSLRGSAVDLWTLVEANASRAMMAESLAARYEADREAIIAAVDHCLTQLFGHALIHETAGANGPLESIPVRPKQALPEPLVECFDDLRDLLLLDPVHEVSEAGWPHVSPDPAD
jgi:hypothetical protein